MQLSATAAPPLHLAWSGSTGDDNNHIVRTVVTAETATVEAAVKTAAAMKIWTTSIGCCIFQHHYKYDYGLIALDVVAAVVATSYCHILSLLLLLTVAARSVLLVSLLLLAAAVTMLSNCVVTLGGGVGFAAVDVIIVLVTSGCGSGGVILCYLFLEFVLMMVAACFAWLSLLLLLISYW